MQVRPRLRAQPQRLLAAIGQGQAPSSQPLVAVWPCAECHAWTPHAQRPVLLREPSEGCSLAGRNSSSNL
eukprot:2459632-Alexandrium_andersonii.AAC.1